MFSNYGEFHSLHERSLTRLIALYFIGEGLLYIAYFVKVENPINFWGKYQIVAQSLNSPKFENMLPANHFCRKFYGGAACGNQTVIVTIGYVIMSIITKLFGCKLDKQYNAEHLIRRVLPNCIKHSMQVHRGLV